MSFKTDLLDDARNVFLNTAELAEEITYMPDEGSARHIKAIVIRERPGTEPQDAGRTLQSQLEIFILCDETDGVARVNKGKDRVILPQRPGEESLEWAVVEVISKDDAIWHLSIQK